MAKVAGDKKAEGKSDVKNGAKPVERIGCRELVGAAVIVGIALVISLLASSRIKEREAAVAQACRRNLRDIQAAKAQYAASADVPPDTVPTEADILQYLGEGPTVAGCPGSDKRDGLLTDSYAINAITSDPVCLICPVDHSLSSSTNR
jgi:hypothetical protein